MKSNHTPGPWRIGDKHQTDIYAARAGHAIARTVNPQHEGECEVNARLIAAAPELLAALIEFVGSKAIEAHHPKKIASARAAIAKATGSAA